MVPDVYLRPASSIQRYPSPKSSTFILHFLKGLRSIIYSKHPMTSARVPGEICRKFTKQKFTKTEKLLKLSKHSVRFFKDPLGSKDGSVHLLHVKVIH